MHEALPCNERIRDVGLVQLIVIGAVCYSKVIGIAPK